MYVICRRCYAIAVARHYRVNADELCR